MWKRLVGKGKDKSDIDKSFKNVQDRFNSLLDLHACYKKLSKYKLKFSHMPWITSGFQKSVSIKITTSQYLLTERPPYKNGSTKKIQKIKESHTDTT